MGKWLLNVYIIFICTNCYSSMFLLVSGVQPHMTTFTMMGGTKIINTYYRNIPAKVRRSLHAAVIRYMEEDCMCPNHVQCDIVPSSLTSEVVLPSYQYYLEREHHHKGTYVVESETLNQFA